MISTADLVPEARTIASPLLAQLAPMQANRNVAAQRSAPRPGTRCRAQRQRSFERATITSNGGKHDDGWGRTTMTETGQEGSAQCRCCDENAVAKLLYTYAG